MKEAYARYRDRGFEIVSFTIDRGTRGLGRRLGRRGPALAQPGDGTRSRSSRRVLRHGGTEELPRGRQHGRNRCKGPARPPSGRDARRSCWTEHFAHWLARISHQAACRRQKLLGLTKLTAMSMIVPIADCAGRALAGLPRPRGSFGPVRARAPSTVVPAMLSVASTRTGPKSSAIITAPGEKCGLASRCVRALGEAFGGANSRIPSLPSG